MLLMAIDYGSKRVGIASTDETGHFALPRAVLENDRTLLDKVLKFKEDIRLNFYYSPALLKKSLG